MEQAVAAKDANVTLTAAHATAQAQEIEATATAKLFTPEYLKAQAIETFFHNEWSWEIASQWPGLIWQTI